MSNPITSFVFLSLVLITVLTSINFNFYSLGEYYLAQLGSSIGVSASVPPNPINSLAKQLKEKEDELNTREQEIVQREQNFKSKNLDGNIFIYGLSGALLVFTLAHLLVDHKRRKTELRV